MLKVDSLGFGFDFIFVIPEKSYSNETCWCCYFIWFIYSYDLFQRKIRFYYNSLGTWGKWNLKV